MHPTHPNYQYGLTDEALCAFNCRDKDTLKALVLDLAAALPNSTDFSRDVAILLCTAGLHDSLHGGKGCMLLCDFVNF